MNKIFKVIWNNAKRCYVVASELAKSHSKSNSSRTIRKSIAALGIAVAFYIAAGSAIAANGGGNPSGDDYIGYSPYTVTIDSNVTGNVYGHKGSSENVEEASVKMTSGTVNDSVYGGYSRLGKAASNSVNIKGGTVGNVYGGFSIDGDAASNSVNIKGGTVVNVYGGLSKGGDAASNSVTISGGTVNDSVYGGYSVSGNSASNSVTINSGNVKGYVYGGYVNTGSGDAASNSVNINGGIVDYDVLGGFSDRGNVASNSANISGGEIGSDVYGGYVYEGSGKADSNRVNISGGIIGEDDYTGNVYGGYVKEGTGDVSSNTINISGGTVKGNVYGGGSSSGDAASNSVKISGGTVNQHVYGGRSTSGNAASNSVYISGDTTNILGNIYGGVASSTGKAYENKVNIATGTLKIVYGGYSQAGNTASNSVSISGDLTKINEVYGGYVNSGAGSASYNIVNISGGTIEQNVFGGWSKKGNAASNSVTISGGTVNRGVFGGYVKEGNGNATSNSVTISGGTLNNFVYGGCVESGSGNAASNSVIISGGSGNVSYSVYGGGIWSGSGDAVNNSVTISGVALGYIENDINYYSIIWGGVSKFGDSASNSVNIINGTIAGYVVGGESDQGNAYGNSVNISGGTVTGVEGGKVILGTGNAYSNSVTIIGGTVNEFVSGGHGQGSGNAASNSVNISGGTVKGNVYGGDSNSGDVASNNVNISGGTVNQHVFGGYIESGSGNTASNSININGGTVNQNVFGGFIESGSGNATSNIVNISGNTTSILGNIYGGVASSTGNAFENMVNIATGTLKIVYGGYSESGSVASNSVNISGDITKINEVYGGYVNSGTGSASYNILNISSGTVNSVYGGVSGSGDAASNSVYISGGTVNGIVYGGKSSSNSSNNSVNISIGTVNGNVYGGSSNSGYVAINIVNISGGTVNGSINGGDTNSGDVASNNVNISGGTVNGPVFGGTSTVSGKVASNSVNISSGTVNKSVYGGYTYSGNVVNNSVTISGGTFKDGSNIYGGYAYNRQASSIVSGNIVNLTDSVTGFEGVNIFGYYFKSNSKKQTGNELHIGGTKTYDGEGNPVVSNGTTWKGKTANDSVNNKVKQIANFETIALHSVAWNDTLPALAAESFKYNNSTDLGGNVTLDITSLTFAQNNPTGTMTLLQSDTEDNFNGLKLAYNDDTITNPVTLNNDAPSVVVKHGEENTGSEKGISFTYDASSHIVSLSDTNKIVDYTIANTYKKSELGEMDFSDGGYQFANTDSINPDGLIVTFGNDFNIKGADTQADDTELTLLDLTQTRGTLKDAIDTTKIVETQKNITDEMTFKISREDSIKSVQEKKKVLYTVGKSKDVTNVIFNSSINWNSDTAYYSNTSFDFTNNKVIDASKLEFKFSNEQLAELSDNSKMTLVSNATNQGQDVNVTYKNNGTGHSQQIDYSASNGVVLSGTMTGSINTSNSSIEFAVSQNTFDSIDISNWDAEKEAAALLDCWSVNPNGVMITATDFNPTLTTGEKTILTASADVFKDENIDESIRYGVNSFENDSENGVTLSGNKTGGVKSSDDGMKLKYYAMSKNVTDISLGSMKWSEGRTIDFDSIYDFKNVTKIDATELMFTNPEIMSGTMDIVDGAKNLGAGIEVIGSSHKQNFDTSLDNKAVVSATLTGEVSVEAEKVKYALDGITINKFDLANWDGEKASSVNNSWKLAESATVETDGMSNLPGSDEEKQVFILKSDTEGYFANVAINGENAYSQKQFTDSDEAESAVLNITQKMGVSLDDAKTNIVYKVGSKDVTSLKLNSVLFKDGAELLSRDKYNYSKLTSLDTGDFNITFEKPETITVNQSMTILKANDTLTDIAAVEKSNAYSYSPVSGVTMDAIIRSSLEAKNGKVTLTTLSHNADKLTFGNVDWLEKGALIDHKTMLNNVSFDGSDVDTTKIAFDNKRKLDADMQMTLVSDFGDSVGTITGDKYKVGTAYEGEGSAYLDGSDLKFKIKTGAGLSDETHTTVMSMDAGIAVLAAGSEQIGTAIEGLGNAANIAPDGTATFATVGGGSARYKTGSHVDTNSWNIALAVGKNLEKRDGTLEYGLFGEYGRGNYTLHMDGVEDAGSGNSRYTGGGLITKWTNSHNVYTEASFRLGNVKENTSNILHDGAGNVYGYDKKARYKGGHIGFGKKYREDENTELEIYSKFFYNERDGINFAVGADHYSLDKVRSRILRAGFRLASTDRKWNRYGGIAYDHEFGGKSTGSVNGMAIRSASLKGGTIRGEFGFRREATKTNPWKTDISLYGFTGKRNGFGGSVAVEYHF